MMEPRGNVDFEEFKKTIYYLLENEFISRNSEIAFMPSLATINDSEMMIFYKPAFLMTRI